MRFSTLLTLAGLLGIAFGVSFLLAPAQSMGVYGLTPDDVAVLMARFLGAAFFEAGAILFLIRGVTDPTTQRRIALGGLVGSIAGLAVALRAQTGGLVNALGWSTVAIYGLFLLAYGRIVLSGPSHD
jgi:hypothetical protein